MCIQDVFIYCRDPEGNEYIKTNKGVNNELYKEVVALTMRGWP
jgi:hypothetical protein